MLKDEKNRKGGGELGGGKKGKQVRGTNRCVYAKRERDTHTEKDRQRDRDRKRQRQIQRDTETEILRLRHRD